MTARNDSNITRDSPVTDLPGIDEEFSIKLKRLRITTVRQLLDELDATYNFEGAKGIVEKLCSMAGRADFHLPWLRFGHTATILTILFIDESFPRLFNPSANKYENKVRKITL